MKKRIIAIAVTLAFALGMTSCGSSMPYDEYDINEYIKAGDYKGLQAAPFTVSVTPDEVEAVINKDLEASAENKDIGKNAEVKKGDIVNIDYTGKLNGKAFEGGSAKGQDLEIGGGKFIDGFEDGLIGKKTGETVDLNLTFPKDYGHKEMAGKKVVFTVKINSAVRLTTPKLDESFAKDIKGYKSVDDYKKAVEKHIYNEKEAQAEMDQKNQLWSQALENAKVKSYPEKEVDNYIKFNSKQIDDMAKEYGISREEMLAQYDFGSEDEFNAVNEDSSKLRVKQEMLIKYIAEKEGLTYTEKEKEALIKDLENQGYDDKSLKKATGRSMEEYAHIELMYGKVLDMMLENAVIKGAAISK